MIAALAAAKGVSHAELAALLDLHRNRFSDKIHGKAPFREAEITTLAEFFAVDPGQLFADPMVLLTGGSQSAWTPNTAGQPHLFLVQTCEACGEDLGHQPSFGRMHHACVERLLNAA